MTYCPVCESDTTSLKIGGQVYCSICGTALTTALGATGPAQVPPPSVPAGKRISLDLTPRSHGNAPHNRPAPVGPPTPPREVKPATPRPAAHPAAELHARVKPAQILDLRAYHHEPPPALIQAAHHTPAAAPSSTTHERHLAHFSDRFEKARQVSRSPHIQKFGGDRLQHHEDPRGIYTDPVQAAAPAPAGPVRHASPHAIDLSVTPTRELPPLAATHHEAMTRLKPTLPPPAPKAPAVAGAKWRPHLNLSANTSRTAATIAAVVIMGGYIWLQNYPKLALQNASQQAGLSASLPSYLPSSYSLAKTEASPGLITLNFSSPSAQEQLKISQHRTTWDASSLLDNFVARNTDDYATVQSQGLTIYLFNSNQATWVNHGIWYSIEGASRLSREQILKIAYSL